jgi:HPt (histidine-containing phosphotransfer) domain-containing protein
VNGDKKLLRELIDVFMTDTPKSLARIQRAVNKKDAGRLKEAAHALKGSIGNFESGNSFELVRKLETMGRDNSLDGAPAILSAAKAELARLNASLCYLKKNLGGRGKAVS